MMFLQVVTVASACLLSFSVSNGVGQNLYLGLLIGEHDDNGAKMGVDDALGRINPFSSGHMLNSIELQVQH